MFGLGSYLAATQTPGIGFRALKAGYYAEILSNLYKLQDMMVRPGRDKIGTEWPIEWTSFCWRQDQKVFGLKPQVPVVIAVEEIRRQIRDENIIAQTRSCWSHKDANTESAAAVDQFVSDCIPGATITSDDGTEFTNLINSGSNIAYYARGLR